MKLTCGLGTIDDCADYIASGADELFIGAVPFEWQARFGASCPLNRREVCFSNVQAGPESELLLMRGITERTGTKAAITVNSPFYRPEQFPLLADIISRFKAEGYASFIIADPALLVYLHEYGLTDGLDIHVSGEAGEANCYILREYRRLGAKRVIFHRKTTLRDMANMISAADGPMEYEAFLMNERCHFNGAYCFSLHCDELPPMCRVPCEFRCADGTYVPPADEPDIPEDVPGASGCGLCALWKMRTAGITHLKIVGRGARREDMLRDISAARRALEILERADSEAAYIDGMRRELFPGGCGGRCYYYDK